MSLVNRNILANLIGGALLAAMMIVLTPLQIGILGMEAYAIIGFITTLQVAFTAFDLGLSSTLTREIASDHSVDKTESRSLIQTAMTIYWIGGALIGLALLFAAAPLATDWFRSETLGPRTIEQSLQVIALYLALRWPVAVYVGILSGLERMEILNLTKVSMLAVRMVGGIAVLLWWRSLEAFLWWTAATAAAEVVAYDLVCRRVHGALPARPGISTGALRRVWRFSASMNLLAVLAVLIVQLDRLLISKLLPLDSLGHYNLAYTAASAITLLVAAVSSAVLPAFASAYAKAGIAALMTRYDAADRLLLFLVTPAAFALVFQGEPVLTLWVGAAAAREAADALAFLAAGFWVSAGIVNVYNAAVAGGVPGWHLKVNLLCVVPYAAVLYAAITAFGIEGAAAAWLLLNLAYALLLVPRIHRRVLGKSTRTWLVRTIAPFALLGIFCFLAPRLLMAPAAWNGMAGAASLAPLLLSLLLWAGAGLLLGFGAPARALVRSALTRLRQ